MDGGCIWDQSVDVDTFGALLVDGKASQNDFAPLFSHYKFRERLEDGLSPGFWISRPSFIVRADLMFVPVSRL